MSASEPSSSPERRVYVRHERGVSHGTFDLAEGAEELFDLGGEYRITLRCSRAPESKHTAMVAVGSTTVTPGVLKDLEDFATDPSKVTTDTIKPFEDEVQELRTQLSTNLQRAFALARWRVGGSGLHSSSPGTKRFWSLDGDTWHEFPLGLGRMNMTAEIIAKWLPDVRRSYADLLRDGVTEPIAYNLLLEALGLRFSYPRSALVIGVAALEVGVKQCIADLAPDTDWLLSNLPSPPVVDLLCDYIPTLKPKVNIKGGKMLQPPKAIRRTLRQAVEARNKLVHRSGETLKDLNLDEVLNTIRDVLFLLEFYRGYEWGWQRMRGDILASMMDEAGLK